MSTARLVLTAAGPGSASPTAVSSPRTHARTDVPAVRAASRSYCSPPVSALPDGPSPGLDTPERPRP
ncbi:hypothetical protein GA0115239_11171, partial [Streptomyces sp. BpilaLS-43]|uniref:hypothetical protein n=1 Tax=Streptomyces sp. BpilaLS-43 TaxID=1839778 RepID=UPI00081AFCFE